MRTATLLNWTMRIAALLVCLLVAAPLTQGQAADDAILYGIQADSGDGHDLFMLDVTDGSSRIIGHIGDFGSDAGWSPDGRFVYLIDYDDTTRTRALTLVDVDANRRQVVTDRLDNDICTLPLRWSPDGRWLAYYTRHDEQYLRVNVLDTADGHLVTLPDLVERYNDLLAWSPDGRYLAQMTASEDRERDTRIWDMEAEQVVATVNAEVGNRAAWSPDSLHFAAGTNEGIFVYNLRDSSTQRYAGEQISAWSPDGRYLSFYRDSDDEGVDMFVVDTQTDEASLFDSAITMGYANTWSSDSRYLVFTQFEPPDSFNQALYLLDMTDSSVRPLGSTIGDSRYVSWSPVGHWLAYATNPNPEGGPGASRLDLFNIDTGHRQTFALEIPPVYYEYPLRWSPDGRYLSVWRGQGIYLYDRQEGRLNELHFGVEPYILSPRWSADGRSLSVYSMVKDSADIFVYDMVEGHSHNVTNTPDVGEIFFGWRGTGQNTSLIYCGEG